MRCADYAVQNNYFNAGAVCSNAALFWAVRAAMASEGLGQTSWAHIELQEKFTDELIGKRRRYPRGFGKWLVNAYALRNFAQHHFNQPQIKELRRTANHAKEVIQIIAELLNK